MTILQLLYLVLKPKRPTGARRPKETGRAAASPADHREPPPSAPDRVPGVRRVSTAQGRESTHPHGGQADEGE